MLSFERSGRIAQIYVERGDPVARGAPVARLQASLALNLRAAERARLQAAKSRLALLRAGSRPEEIEILQAELRAAQASETRLRTDYRRARALVADGVEASATRDELERELEAAQAAVDAAQARLHLARIGTREEQLLEAEAAVRAAEASLDLAQSELDLYRLHSPIAGTIIELHREPGEVAPAAAPVASAADLQHPYADVFVPLAKLAQLHLGSRAHVMADGKVKLRGAIEYIHARAEFTPRFIFSEAERDNFLYRVRVRIEDPVDRLRSGVPVFVRFPGGDAFE